MNSFIFLSFGCKKQSWFHFLIVENWKSLIVGNDSFIRGFALILEVLIRQIESRRIAASFVQIKQFRRLFATHKQVFLSTTRLTHLVEYRSRTALECEESVPLHTNTRIYIAINFIQNSRLLRLDFDGKRETKDIWKRDQKSCHYFQNTNQILFVNVCEISFRLTFECFLRSSYNRILVVNRLALIDKNSAFNQKV